jgi:cyclin ccl1
MILLSREDLNEKRKLSNQSARTGSCFIDDQEQLALIQFYTLKIRDYCRVFKFSPKIQLTSIMLFKRFYIEQSAMEHDPKLILIACLFLSTKIEHEPVSLQEFLDKIPKGPQKHDMLELELTLSSHIDFDFSVDHPIWPLHGFFLDLQQFHSPQELFQSYQNAVDVCTDLYLTDCPLIYSASQIAIAALFKCSKPEMMESYLRERFSDHFLDLRRIIDEIVEMTSLETKIDKEKAKVIAKKCQICLESRIPRPTSPPSDVEGPTEENNNPFE